MNIYLFLINVISILFVVNLQHSTFSDVGISEHEAQNPIRYHVYLVNHILPVYFVYKCMHIHLKYNVIKYA